MPPIAESSGETLFSRRLIPFCGEFQVFFATTPVFIRNAEIELSPC